MIFYKLLIFIGFYLCTLHMIQSATLLPTVTIGNTTIIGHTVTFYESVANQYLGIPYAKPPTGQLRFKRPVPYTDYYTKAKFPAYRNPKACPQYNEDPVPWAVNTTEIGEDCLYLNIWTPADASQYNRKAVLYWIHGGGYRTGSIRAKVYDGTRLAVLGDIIVVTVNYRLGYFGFLASGSEDAPGNAALYDVLEGLKWINQHIAAFGGDTDRITVAGQSVGALDIAMLSSSPLSRGLYARQIMMSGSAAYRIADHSTAKNLAYSQRLAEYLGCANESFSIDAYPKEVLGCLKGIDSETISRADYHLSPTDLPLLPEWGNEILPINPRMAILSGNFECTDTLIGTTGDEGALLVTTSVLREYLGFFGQHDLPLNRTTGEAVIRGFAAIFPDSGSIVDHYLPADLADGIRSRATAAAGDMALECPTVYYADQCAAQGKKVYYYRFVRRPSVSPWAPWMGAVHFEEVQFLFGLPIFDPAYTDEEEQLSFSVIDIWSSFVKSGNTKIPWPLYSRESRSYKIFGQTGENIQWNVPHFKDCDFMLPLFVK